jgi:small-conductance mechanosensitive channel
MVREGVLTVAIAVAPLVVVRIGRRLIEHYVDAPERQYRATRYFRRTVLLVAAVLVLIVWSPGLRDLVSVVTIVGAGFAIALREILLSLAGWLRLDVRALYKQGDRVEIGGGPRGSVTGDVVDIRLLHTTVMEVGVWVGAEQSTGRLVHLPNSLVFQPHRYLTSRSTSLRTNERSSPGIPRSTERPSTPSMSRSSAA